MTTLQTTLLVLQVFIALGLIAIILVQHGKGADAGAAFGSGASNTVFGSQGSGNFLTKMTTLLAVVFLVNSLTLGYLAANTAETVSLMEQHAAEQAEQERAADEQGTASGGDDDMPAIPQQ
ncbi:preprotein translocase subunit SecG [Methylohalomonas lacus]|uniref:Protein-export membrane protein SecG n=1 Tax=Methylohalomonas lacus TaxID=398773 RepID=A0AAE3HJH3_9GAMM|nr:preprotein translocase subunit SecG [Methylohalomonas lacus]MCS3902900.1 preprotein translocase subunit SecG [Methylohalomonas lacus]